MLTVDLARRKGHSTPPAGIAKSLAVQDHGPRLCRLLRAVSDRTGECQGGWGPKVAAQDPVPLEPSLPHDKPSNHPLISWSISTWCGLFFFFFSGFSKCHGSQYCYRAGWLATGAVDDIMGHAKQLHRPFCGLRNLHRGLPRPALCGQWPVWARRGRLQLLASCGRPGRNATASLPRTGLLFPGAGMPHRLHDSMYSRVRPRRELGHPIPPNSWRDCDRMLPTVST